MSFEIVADTRCVIGENPLWHPTEGRLYWVDIPRGELYRYDPGTGRHEVCLRTEPIGGFTIQADGALLLFMARGAVRTWRDGQLETVIEEIPEERQSRFNDVIADPAGRVLCGTMPCPSHPGSLYRLDADGQLTRLFGEVGCSNGMGFTPDRKGFYFTDTRKREIYLFDYNQRTGEIANRRVFLTVPEDQGGPDGMTVDAEGFVWSARWGGWRVVRHDPAGREVERIDLPAKKVSSVTFAGLDFRDLYVTTAGGDNRPADGPAAGALLRLRVSARGRPEFLSRVGLSK